MQYQERLQLDLEDRDGLLDVYGEGGAIIGRLKEVTLRFETNEALDVPLSVEYEVTYSRSKPSVAPPATKVVTAVHYKLSE
ncbi:hypothetical protein [Paenibacillus sp. MMO-177]|uniref:hypothetical protein n=1 Tax=Paenibacillus sp. MMO-177 TaxID=3081289 RepID=UPI003017C114